MDKTMARNAQQVKPGTGKEQRLTFDLPLTAALYKEKIDDKTSDDHPQQIFT